MEYYSKPRRNMNLRKMLTYTFAVLVIIVLYLLLFNPPLPQTLTPVISPIIWIVEFGILILGLMLINGFGLGESDLGIWGMGIFGVILIILGVIFFFTAGFVPRFYEGYDAWFGIILGILGIFAGFRMRRRHGTFVYLR